jgi:DNA-directed RNA polymerase specialized sigma24 family protein
MRPWLARVVRNAVRFRWRSDANRTAREAVVARQTETATPTSEELLARHELQQLVAKLIGKLVARGFARIAQSRSL